MEKNTPKWFRGYRQSDATAGKLLAPAVGGGEVHGEVVGLVLVRDASGGHDVVEIGEADVLQWGWHDIKAAADGVGQHGAASGTSVTTHR